MVKKRGHLDPLFNDPRRKSVKNRGKQTFAPKAVDTLTRSTRMSSVELKKLRAKDRAQAEATAKGVDEDTNRRRLLRQLEEDARRDGLIK